jgi:small subunit ribosomal protein S4e
MHLKRNEIGKFWPIPRKGNKYVALSTHNKKESMPLVVIARDILKVVKNRKELKGIISERKVLVNHKIIKETNYPVGLFDIITFPDSNKNYKAVLSKNKKMDFKEVSQKESQTKVYRINGRVKLGKDKIQLNLIEGKNIISKEKVKTGDSVVLNLKDNKIIKIILLEKGRTVFVIKGKHMGVEGKITEIVERGGKSIAKISYEDKKINVWIKNIIVME